MSGKGSSIAAGKGQTFILTCREQREDSHHDLFVVLLYSIIILLLSHIYSMVLQF